MNIKVLNFEKIDYQKTESLMEEIKNKILNNPDNSKDIYIIFAEHNDIFTAGKSSKESKYKNIKIIPTNRGGQDTFHGRGQQVCYIVANLKHLHQGNPDIRKFVNQLEEVVILTLRQYGAKGLRNKLGNGVWVETEKNQSKKISSIGIKLSKWITLYGFSININCDLDNFNQITPCGIPGCQFANLRDLTSTNISNKELKSCILDQIIEVFNLCKKFR